MQSVLVAGGAGFIGSHLCDLLHAKGFQVFCLDNLLTGALGNLKELEKKDNFKFIEGDVCDPVSIEEKIDYVFHLASPASPIDYQKYPEETLKTNSLGTLEMLEFAKTKEAKILVASTSEVYGDPLEHPQKETYFGNVNSFGPRSCYDESKRFAETATYVFMKKYGLDGRIVRIFNTYGPRMQADAGRVISNFINQAILDREIVVDGDGSQTRSFCYVDDMVDGLMKAMFSEKTNGEIFNLGNPDEYTIKDLAQKIVKLMSSKSKIIFNGKFRQDDPMRRRPDISKAEKTFSWIPATKLEDGLRKTIAHYKSL